MKHQYLRMLKRTTLGIIRNMMIMPWEVILVKVKVVLKLVCLKTVKIKVILINVLCYGGFLPLRGFS